MIFYNYEEVFVMDYSQEYKQKLVSADEAVKLIKSGDWVDFGWCTNTVDALDQALAKRTDELTNVNLRGGILLKPLATFAREDEDKCAYSQPACASTPFFVFDITFVMICFFITALLYTPVLKMQVFYPVTYKVP